MLVFLCYTALANDVPKPGHLTCPHNNTSLHNTYITHKAAVAPKSRGCLGFQDSKSFFKTHIWHMLWIWVLEKNFKQVASYCSCFTGQQTSRSYFYAHIYNALLFGPYINLLHRLYAFVIVLLGLHLSKWFKSLGFTFSIDVFLHFQFLGLFIDIACIGLFTFQHILQYITVVNAGCSLFKHFQQKKAFPFHIVHHSGWIMSIILYCRQPND